MPDAEARYVKNNEKQISSLEAENINLRMQINMLMLAKLGK